MKKLWLALSVLAIFALGAGPSSADIVTGLIADYSFSGNAVDTIGGNNGTVYNATLTTDRFGNPNSAYYFNGISTLSGGGSYIQLAHNFNFVSMGNLTFSAWVKPAGDGGYIFHQANGGQLALRTSGGYADFFAHLANGNWYNATDPDLVAQDTWVNLTGVYYARNKNELWVNGNLVATTTLADSNLFDVWWSDYFYAGIGAYYESWYSDSLQGAFTGTIDDFRIYNRALSASDVQELAGVPIPGAVWLLGSGLIGLAAMRKRRRS